MREVQVGEPKCTLSISVLVKEEIIIIIIINKNSNVNFSSLPSESHTSFLKKHIMLHCTNNLNKKTDEL